MALKRWTKQQERARAEFGDVTPQERRVAHRVAATYSKHVYSKTGGYGTLARVDPKLEQSRWWHSFVKVARLLISLGETHLIDAYLAAQFRGMAWKRGAYPFPQQLASDGAAARWARARMQTQSQLEARARAETTMVHDPNEMAEEKLATWVERTQCSSRHILRHYPHLFTESFRRQHGVFLDD